MRNAWLVVLLSLSIPMFAGDLLVSSLTLDKTFTPPNERVTATWHIRNDGPETAGAVLAELWFQGGFGTFLSASGPAGWTCSGAFVKHVYCTASGMAAGAEAEFHATFLTDDGGVVRADISGGGGDPDGNNNTRTISLGSGVGNFRADLGVSLTIPDVVLFPGASSEFQVGVQNDGPHAAQNVSVVIGLFGLQIANEGPLTASGTGWTCSALPSPFEGGPRVICTRLTLGIGQQSTITASFSVPAEGRLRAETFIVAEGSADFVVRNDLAAAELNVGDAANWQRLLLPITTQTLNGAHGSQWVTEIAALVQSDETIALGAPCFYVTPEAAEVGNCSTPPYELRKPFDAFDYGWIFTCNSPGQFLYVSGDDAQRLRMNMRVRDVSRAQETAGSEIPIVTGQAFRTGSLSLLNIPAHDQYRYTLRIYDADAKNGATVTVRLYADDEELPRASSTRTLNAACATDFSTPFDLPSHPASTQLDLSELGVDVTGLDSFRIELEPVTPGLRIWGFVSITNNETHHVTIVSPHHTH